MTAKQSAQQAIDQLPDQASWQDIIYELQVKQKIEEGLLAVEEGRTVHQDKIKDRVLNR